MNTLHHSLSAACRARPLAEKRLLAPSLRVARQWLDAVARGGQPVLNVHALTLKGLAIELATPALGSGDGALRLASGRARTLLVERVLANLRPRLRYLGGLTSGAGLADAVAHSLDALRLAGLDVPAVSAASEAGRFETADKGADLRLILAEYRSLLASERLVDYADVLTLAVDRLAREPRALAAEWLLVPADLAVRPLERELLRALPAERVQLLATDEPGWPAGHEPEQVAARVWPKQGAPLAPAGPAISLRLFRAVGEVNEVRQVLRTCLAEQIPWDHVEVLHSDAETYLPLVYETVCSLLPDSEDLGESVPVTFAEGIPSRYAHPGRALALWVEWVRGEFDQHACVTLIREGLLNVKRGEDGASFARLAGLLRSVAIGATAERYASRLDDEIERLGKRIDALATPGEDDEDPVRKAEQLESLSRRRDDFRQLRKLCLDLLGEAPALDAQPGVILEAALHFIRNRARNVNQLDGSAVLRLTAEIEETARWISPEQTSRGVWDWLAQLPDATRVLGSGPRPGAIHVANVLTGGQAGRPCTWVLGLDDTRFPRGGHEDPLLLDHECRQISPALRTSGSALSERLAGWARLLARLRGRVWLGYSSHSATDEREQFASPVLLDAFRQVAGQPAGDHADLLRWLDEQAPPAAPAPALASESLHAADWWQWRSCGAARVLEPFATVAGLFPHLAAGRLAADQRDSPIFTPFDGFVPAAAAITPCAAKRVVSAHQLQLLGRCPLAYFFGYGLGLSMPEDLQHDPGVWLDVLAAGKLLHTVFERYVRGLMASGLAPSFARDHAAARALLEEEIVLYRELYPVPGISVFRRQCEQFQETLETFLREEELYCTTTGARPVYVETALGMQPEEGAPPDPLSTTEPIAMALGDGRRILVRGRIDRIDLLATPGARAYTIWDYKTGGTWGYSRANPFQQGRILQPYLYVTIVGHRLREVVGADARVEQFGFFFPGRKAAGERLTWEADVLADGRELVQQLCNLTEQGAFPATNDVHRDCTWCDFRSICGNLNRLQENTEAKLDYAANTVLVPWRALRHG